MVEDANQLIRLQISEFKDDTDGFRAITAPVSENNRDFTHVACFGFLLRGSLRFASFRVALPRILGGLQLNRCGNCGMVDDFSCPPQ